MSMAGRKANGTVWSRWEPFSSSMKLPFSAVEVGGSTALGGDVRLELSARTTVLVGRNGAGKSLLLEKIEAGFNAAGGVASSNPDPAHFACDFAWPEERKGKDSPFLRYECRWRSREPPPEEPALRPGARERPLDVCVEESCVIHGGKNGKDQLLFRVDDGVLSRSDGTRSEISPCRTVVNWSISRHKKFVMPRMAEILFDVFHRVSRIPAGLPRSDGSRAELSMPYSFAHQERELSDKSLRHLARTLAHWHEEKRALFDEFVELGRRTLLLRDVQVKIYRDPDVDVAPSQRRDLVRVLLDGVDLGLASGGTLRVAAILVALVSPDSKLLLVDEPESAVHPGLLERLLAEIEAYSTDRQIVLATQSPQVVSWAKPKDLRLVERRDGRTQVRRIGRDEIRRISKYLHDQGNLGEFVYSGALDG
jgi:predicted ATPase